MSHNIILASNPAVLVSSRCSRSCKSLTTRQNLRILIERNSINLPEMPLESSSDSTTSYIPNVHLLIPSTGSELCIVK